MNVAPPCPKDSKLLDLLDGNLVDPELSHHAEHLEHCSLCQQKVSQLSIKGTLTEALLGQSTTFDRITNQTPRLLVERIKQIPMLATDHSVSNDPHSSLSNPSTESVVFAADPTPGGLGRLGPYRILKLLGSGGMGSVFLAEDSKLHRQVALKVMLPRIAADPIAKQRFLREARAAASLKSEHIVTIYQVDEVDNIPYLTMEFLEGQSLDETIRTSKQLAVQDIISIITGVIRGLADAHEKGLIHRDIKPGNIWIQYGKDSSPRVKILDFGLARMDADDPHLTHASAIVGTPAFMAPEQARGEKSADARSDLFSLGCVLYYMCTNQIPFKANSTLGTLMALAVDTPESPSVRNASIPLKLSRLTMSLLEKDPNKRPQTAREVLAVIKNVRRELELGIAEYASTDTLKNATDTDIKRPTNRGRILVGIVPCALIASVAFMLVQPKPDGSETSALPFASTKLDTLEQRNPLDRQANEQLKNTLEKFKLRNPRFEGAFHPTLKNGTLIGLTITGSNVSDLEAIRDLNSLQSLLVEGGSTWESVTIDLSPIQGIPLNRLGLHGGYVISNLNALRGMPLEELDVLYSPVSDLTPLEGMQLRRLGLWSWAGNDLTPLHGMPLEQLNIGGNGKAIDLGPLAGAPLQFLCINVSGVSDLSPLMGMPIKQLYCSNTNVSDLSPVKDAAIEEIMVDGTLVHDLSIAKGWPLKRIKFNSDVSNWREVLKDIPTLQRIQEEPADTVLTEFDTSKWMVPDAAFVNSIGMEFALVPKGKTFRGTGNFDEYLGSKEIEIDQDFYLGRFEVTQAEWIQLMGSNPSHFSKHGPGADPVRLLTDSELARLPVERVSWTDCQGFLTKLNELEGDSQWKYRLPTEAEWTYACQGGPMGENFDRKNMYFFNSPSISLLSYQANFKLSGLNRTCKVGAFIPNRLGLFDMHGNVWEWCDDLAKIPGKRERWIHGGSWRDEAERCKASFLLEPTEPWTYFDLGIRVARVPTE